MKLLTILLMTLLLTSCGESKEPGEIDLGDWNNWLQMYQCNDEQTEQMIKYLDACKDTNYKSEFCFATAKRDYCTLRDEYKNRHRNYEVD